MGQAVASFGKFLPHLSVGVEKGRETAHAALDVVSGSHRVLLRAGGWAGFRRARASSDFFDGR